MSKRIVFKNFNDDVDSHMRTDATEARTYQFPDKDITVAGVVDIDTTTVVAISGATSLDSTAYGKLHTLSGTTYTVDLPTAAENAGKTIAFKGLVGLGAATLDGLTTETIDGETTRVVGSRGIFVLQSDGTNWIIVHEVGSWIAWTPTFTGFSADPSSVDAKYFRVGNKIEIRMSMSPGTSNSTAFTITLPFNALAEYNYVLLMFNAGAGVAGRGRVQGASNVLTLWASAAAGNWTASGNKWASVVFTYEKA